MRLYINKNINLLIIKNKMNDKKIMNNCQIVEKSNKKLFKIKKNYQITEWRKDEDEFLLKILSKKKRNKWSFLLKTLQNRTQKECLSRFKSLNNKYVKGRWTQEEDEKLLNLVENFGKNWKLISKVLKNRSNKQIRTRFADHLDEKVNKTKFSEAEDLKLIDLYANQENKFCASIFKKHFSDRTAKDLKNRLDYLIRNNMLGATTNESSSKSLLSEANSQDYYKTSFLGSKEQNKIFDEDNFYSEIKKKTNNNNNDNSNFNNKFLFQNMFNYININNNNIDKKIFQSENYIISNLKSPELEENYGQNYFDENNLILNNYNDFNLYEENNTKEENHYKTFTKSFLRNTMSI